MEDLEMTLEEQLPNEILLNIFENLKWRDILNAQLTCQRWYLISQHPTIQNKAKLFFKNSDLNSTKNPLLQFLEKPKNFKSISLWRVDFQIGHDLLWNYLSQSIEEVDFQSIKVNFDDFIIILKSLTNLRKLKLSCCNFNKDEGLMIPANFKQNNLLKKLNYLSLNTYSELMTSQQINEIFTLIPNLEKFKCSTWLGNEHVDPFIIEFIRRQKNLRILHLNLDMNTSNRFLSKFFDLNNLKKLEVFSFNNFYGQFETHVKFREFIETLENLKSLKIHYDAFIEPDVIHICNNLPKLKFLKIEPENFLRMSKLAIAELSKLECLEGLEITNTENMATEIIRSLTHNRNDTIRSLNLFNISEPLDVRVLENLKNIPNLNELILRQCKCVSDIELQVIIKYLIHLRKLIITTPFGSFTDFGLTGEPLTFHEGYSISRLTDLEHLYLVGESDHFSDNTLEHVKKLKNLKILNINTNGMSLRGVELITSMHFTDHLN